MSDVPAWALPYHLGIPLALVRAREEAEVRVRILLDATNAPSEDVAARVATLLRRNGHGDLEDQPMSAQSLRVAYDLILRGADA